MPSTNKVSQEQPAEARLEAAELKATHLAQRITELEHQLTTLRGKDDK